MARPKKNEAQKNELKPNIEVSEGTGYKVKDDHFDKYKSFIDKKDGLYKEIEADWRSLSIGGVQMTVHQGFELTKEQLIAFNDKAKDYWLEKVSKKKAASSYEVKESK